MSSNKTEQPTAKKRRDARKKGQVAHSKDLTQNLLLVALFAYLLVAAGMLARTLGEGLLMPMDFLQLPFEQAWPAVLWPLLQTAVWVLLPFIGIVLLVGLAGETLQVGFFLAFESIKPSGKKLNVVANAKNMVSKKNLVEFLKNIIKTSVIGALVYSVIRSQVHELLTLPLGGIAGVGEAICVLLRAIIIDVALAYTVLALADFVWQRYSHTRDLMMDKNEIKQEHKESEGDPHIKGKRKSLHKEMAQGGGAARARQATVLITNPTHVAAALYYHVERTPLPLVLAIGTEAQALEMIAAAREAGVPVMQNIPLARALLREAVVEQYIPATLIEPVAEVLRLVAEVAANGAPETPP